MRFPLLLVKFSILTLIFSATIFAQDPEMVRHFDYDTKAPLELKTLGKETRGDAVVHDITYASPKGGVVPLNEKQTADNVQQVVDFRRGVDLLLARGDVDPKRVAFVGHSYNASVGAILSGVDRRFKAFVLMAGTLSDEVDLQSDAYKEFREKIGPEKVDAFMKKFAYLDQGKYVSHAAPAVVFMQFATQEQFLTPERARAYEKIVSEPKRFKLYEAPHALNAEATRDRVAFLTEQLKLKPLAAKVIHAIPELYQPPRANQ